MKIFNDIQNLSRSEEFYDSLTRHVLARNEYFLSAINQKNSNALPMTTANAMVGQVAEIVTNLLIQEHLNKQTSEYLLLEVGNYNLPSARQIMVSRLGNWNIFERNIQLTERDLVAIDEANSSILIFETSVTTQNSSWQKTIHKDRKAQEIIAGIANQLMTNPTSPEVTFTCHSVRIIQQELFNRIGYRGWASANADNSNWQDSGILDLGGELFIARYPLSNEELLNLSVSVISNISSDIADFVQKHANLTPKKSGKRKRKRN